MIYGRFGQQVTIMRVAVLADIQRLDGRKPDKQDREALANGSYVIVEDGGKERLYHQAFLRADGGAQEISRVIASRCVEPNAAGPPKGRRRFRQ